MNDKGYNIKEILSIVNQLSADMECFKQLGCLTDEYEDEYRNRYENFVYTNENSKLNGVDCKQDTAIKGKALEDLVSCLFESTGGYFKIYNNIRNGSNEIDLFVTYSNKAIAVRNLLDSKYMEMLCECKNYKDSISVTYVGKFYSLMQCTGNKIGIMFSYNGFSGSSWGGASGLTKKIFLLREHEEDKIKILDFNKKDFEAILDGRSIFEILDDKCKELKLGIDDISKYCKKHPNEDRL